MKKQDIKADPIRDKIIAASNYMSENSQKVWIVLGVISVFIISLSIYSNKNQEKLLNANNALSIIQNKEIYDSSAEDSLINSEYEKALKTLPSSETYNQAFIHVLNYALSNNDIDKVNNLLLDNKFDSDDNMMNGYLFKLKGDLSLNENPEKAISLYKKAIDVVPNYDLKVKYSIDLIDFYISEKKYNLANIALNNIKDVSDEVENLPISAKNNLDYIESKLSQLSK